MGKFKNQNLKFKTDEAVIFGSGDEASIGYDGTDLTVDVPILGSAPTKDDHLATKKSVDDADTAVSGAIDEKLAGKANSAHNHYEVKLDADNSIVISSGDGPPIKKIEFTSDGSVVGKWEQGKFSLASGNAIDTFSSTFSEVPQSDSVPTEWAVSQYIATVSGDITSYGDETYADTVHTHDKIVENYADPYYNAVITVHSGGGMDPLNRYILFVQDSVEVGKFKDGRFFLTNGTSQGVDTISYDFSGRIGDLGNASKTLPTEYAVANYVDTISGAIIAQIPSLSGYATDAEVSTISGDIIAQIPSVVDFVTDAEITVISGDIIAQIGGGAFIDLSDVPSDYTDDGNKYVKVKASADGLEFVTGGGGAFTDLSDVPNDYTDDAGKYVRVNGTADGLEFATVSADLVNDTTPQLGGELDTNQMNIRLTASGGGADDTACGLIATMTVDTCTVGVGSALFMAADGNFDEALATATGTMPCTALALVSGTGSQKVLLMGFMRHDAWAWTPGLPIFVSTTAGTLTQTGPTATGQQVQIVGYATHADRMYFNPQLLIGEVK